MANTSVTAIIPVYNDRAALETAIPRSIEVLQGITGGHFEIIVAEDGSTDGSADLSLAQRLEPGIFDEIRKLGVE